MTDLRTAAQQAREALKMMRDEYGEANCPACDHADAAMYALNDALAEPVQKPVKQCAAHGECFGGECIYTTPPQRKENT